MLIRLANDDLVEYPDELGALVLAEPIHGDVPDFSLEELNCVINCTLGVLFDEKSPSGIKTTPPWFYSLWTGRFGQHRGAWGLGEFFFSSTACIALIWCWWGLRCGLRFGPVWPVAVVWVVDAGAIRVSSALAMINSFCVIEILYQLAMASAPAPGCTGFAGT